MYVVLTLIICELNLYYLKITYKEGSIFLAESNNSSTALTDF